MYDEEDSLKEANLRDAVDLQQQDRERFVDKCVGVWDSRRHAKTDATKRQRSEALTKSMTRAMQVFGDRFIDNVVTQLIEHCPVSCLIPVEKRLLADAASEMASRIRQQKEAAREAKYQADYDSHLADAAAKG